MTFMYAVERKPSLQLAPETVFKSTFQMVKYHRDRVPLASEGIRDCGVHSGGVAKAGRNSEVSLSRPGFFPALIPMPEESVPSSHPQTHFLLHLAGVATGLLLFL